MAQDSSNLIWIDLEMTGLDTERDQVIEIATIVTDSNLNPLAEGPMLAIHQSAEVMEAMVSSLKGLGGHGVSEALVYIKEMSIGLAIILFLIFEPDGLAHRWRMIKSYWKLYPFSY